MGDSMTRYAAAMGASLKSEVVQTLHTTVFTVSLEEVGQLFRANEDATKLSGIAHDITMCLRNRRPKKSLPHREGPRDDWQHVSSGGDLYTAWR